MKKNISRVVQISLLCIALLLCLRLLPISADAADLSRLEQAIIDSYTTGREVNVTPYNLTRKELFNVFWNLRTSGQLPWYARRDYSVEYDAYTLQAYTFYPKTLSKSSYDRDLYETRIQEILDASIHEGMTQLQKALAIHDHLITHCKYDQSKQYNTGYDLVVRGTTMCNGYAEAYMDIMTRLGIPCKLTESTPMNHSWNLVQLDGQWYHVDLTWDDPTPNSYGTALHSFFLLTDEEMLARKHHGWETDVTCTDTRYANAFWQEAESTIVYLDSNTCFVRRYQHGKDYIYIRDETSGTETVVFSDSKTSINIGYGNRSYVYRGLSLWNSRLYFASLDTVYSCELDGSGLQTVYSYDAVANQKYIYGILAEDDTFFVTFRDHDRNTSTLEIPLNNADQHIHHYASEQITATCVTGGSSQYHCNCGFSFTAATVAPLGHQYQQVSLEPGEGAGKEPPQLVCIRCGHSRNASTLPLTADVILPMVVILGIFGFLRWFFAKRNRSVN